jgi:L-lactate dehydrogenase complex protein LldG
VSTGGRDVILGRIRSALRDVPSGEQPQDVDVPREYERSHAAGELADLFAERVEHYRATVTRTAEADLPSAIAEALRRREIGRLVVPPGLPEEYVAGLAENGSTPGGCELLRDEPPLTVRELDAAHGVLTTAALAIAFTGTIVLDAGPGQGRRALTLLPDYHLCVVRADQIAADVPDALGRLDPSRPLTMISGPSATSDIENTRVEGVHGPRTLDVLLVAASELAESES